ncbi:hypothetical protein SESBI_02940 [Sesbania bispinosa]|nr:hypothetical protein SESBI_02940 [Sesbania bispinosa]
MTKPRRVRERVEERRRGEIATTVVYQALQRVLASTIDGARRSWGWWWRDHEPRWLATHEAGSCGGRTVAGQGKARSAAPDLETQCATTPPQADDVALGRLVPLQ